MYAWTGKHLSAVYINFNIGKFIITINNDYDILLIGGYMNITYIRMHIK